MLVFWMAAGGLAAAAAVVVMVFARRSAVAGASDPTLSAYSRQLAEVDELVERGLLSGPEHAAARAEAGRRLLRAADRREASAARPAPRWAAALAAAAAAGLALALYVLVGRPDLGDQPFAARVQAWRAAPEALGPQEAAAVLQSIVRDRPDDAEGHVQLGRARLAADDAFGAARAFETAARLQPGRPEHWTDLARAFLALQPPAAADARRALRRALELAPEDLNARYWFGHVAAAEGDAAGALAQWRALAAELSAEDPRRAALEAEIAAVAAPRADDPAIVAMVEGLAARLRTQPDDPAGWARLVRAYAVLGREADLAAALAEARRRFAGEALARIEAEAAAGRRLQPAP